MSASCAPNRDHPTNHPVPNHATMSREPSCDEKLGYSVVRTGDTMMALATAALSMASSEGNGNNEEVRDWNWKNSSKEKAALAANETNASSDVSMHHDDRLGEELGVQCLHLLKFSRSIHDLAKAEVPTAETQRMASGGIPSAYVPIIPPIDDASMASGRLHRPGGAQEQRAAATRMASSTKHALLLLAASKRAEDGNAATKDARAMPKRVVYASSMGLRSLEKTAVAKDVPNLLREVESAFDTGPPSQNVAMRVVPTMQRRVESALGMGRMCLENSVVMRDVPTGRRRVGSVQGMGQHGHSMK
eukprot:CAMPEP_0183707514 /NCGR_PEP_ID=MMETSP0737-20130205/4070_1 /TAXON_ID=385413 /ORGANISM="Thalassiosira miniscula, Strain CCMP1093" /LENGTH=303 /DNA_ID=CAMNT_0025935201 /DNA_START=160 /DNA_END=1072 /DNA_ORIENTATION=-